MNLKNSLSRIIKKSPPSTMPSQWTTTNSGIDDDVIKAMLDEYMDDFKNLNASELRRMLGILSPEDRAQSEQQVTQPIYDSHGNQIAVGDYVVVWNRSSMASMSEHVVVSTIKTIRPHLGSPNTTVHLGLVNSCMTTTGVGENTTTAEWGLYPEHNPLGRQVWHVPRECVRFKTYYWLDGDTRVVSADIPELVPDFIPKMMLLFGGAPK